MLLLSSVGGRKGTFVLVRGGSLEMYVVPFTEETLPPSYFAEQRTRFSCIFEKRPHLRSIRLFLLLACSVKN